MSIYAPRPDADQLLLDSEQVYTDYVETVSADPEYPKLHLAPPVGRLNDPNGLIYDDGVYHAFYQYSPLHPTRAVFWRHAVSTDLTNWSDQKTAIAPISWYDKSGCYSGSGFVAPDGSYEFFYTGNVKDEMNNRSAYQSMFTSNDKGKTFEREENNPLIFDQPEGYTAHYRDPHLVERNGIYYAFLGAQRTNNTGAVVCYSSSDRREWTFEGEIEFSDTSIGDMSYMIECPIFLTITDTATGVEKDIFIFCPQGMQPDGDKYNNIYQCGYVVGKLDGLKFDIEQPFTEIDAGFEFYAPQTVHAADEEHDAPVLMGWFGNAEEDDHPSWENRWVHMLTYPRELELHNGKLFQCPVKQLDEVLPLQAAQMSEDGILADVRGRRQFRLKGTLNVGEHNVQLGLRDEKGEPVVMTFGQDFAALDRGFARYQAGGPIRRRMLTPSNSRQFEILFDGSALEMFVDAGAEVFSARIYLDGAPQAVFVRPPEQGGVPAVENLSVAYLED